MTAPTDSRPLAPGAVTALVVGIVTVLAAPVFALGLTALAIVVLKANASGWALVFPVAGLLVGAPACVLGVTTLMRLQQRQDERGRGHAAAGLVLGVLGGLTAVGLAVVGTFLGAVGLAGPGGRPFRVGGQGRPRAAPAIDGNAWSAPVAPALDGLDAAARTARAAAWEREARGEHASVAAFARLALDLLAAGAPPALVAGAHRAALDEVAHARACFALASAYAGHARTAGPWPEAATGGTPAETRLARLERLAVESLRDGCLHEGFAAASARAAAEVARDSVVGGVLADLARDEERHAELAWAVLDWCVAEGAAPVRAGVARALAALPVHCERGDLAPGDGAADEARRIYAAVRAAVVARGERALDARDARPHAVDRPADRPADRPVDRPADRPAG